MSARQTHAPNAINHLYPLHNANYNVTALVTAHTGPADTNDDGYADFGDYNAITSHFGHATGGGDAVGDLNHDGVVDELDVDIWLSHNGNSYGATPTWQVTERLAYNPYGAFTVSVQDDTGTWRSDLAEYLGWNITFQGGRWDSLTRMVSFAGSKFGRSENVDTGRWVSQDIGYLDSSNLYLFCAANPINRRDPSGTTVDPSQITDPVTAYNRMLKVSIKADAVATGEAIRCDVNHGANAAILEAFFNEFNPGGTGAGTNAFIYTCAYGFIDLGHLWGAALATYVGGATGFMAQSYGIEEEQKASYEYNLSKHSKIDPWGDSYYTAEDLVSDFLGYSIGKALRDEDDRNLNLNYWTSVITGVDTYGTPKGPLANAFDEFKKLINGAGAIDSRSPFVMAILQDEANSWLYDASWPAPFAGHYNNAFRFTDPVSSIKWQNGHARHGLCNGLHYVKL